MTAKEELLERIGKAGIKELKKILENDDIAFWSSCAEQWNAQVPEHVREFIRGGIKCAGKHIELGAGSVQYARRSAVLDYSREMLKRSPAKKKILRDLNKPLRLKEKFDSASMVFVANYLENPQAAFAEIKKILKPGGILTLVQSKYPLARLYQLQEYRAWTPKEIIDFLGQAGFSATSERKRIKNTELVFIRAGLL